MNVLAGMFSFFIANADSVKNQPNLLNEVVITASRSKTIQFQSPNSIEVISRKQLNNNVLRTTPESLTGINGAFIQKTNHGGGSVFLRGLTGNQTLILVDGIRLNNSTFRYGPNQYLNTIDPFSIDKIEVLKGSGSVQYGSDAMGGTIQVFTEEPAFNTGLKTLVLTRIASQNMEKTLRPQIGFGTKNIAINGSLSFRNYGDIIGGKSIGKQTPTGYDEKTANLKVIFKIGDGIFTAAHQSFTASNVPIYHKIILENFKKNEFGKQNRNLTYLKYFQKTEKPILETISITTSLQNTYESRISQKNGSNIETTEGDKVNTIGIIANIGSEIAPNWKANSGIEMYTDKVESLKESKNLSSLSINKATRGLYPNNSKYLNLSAYSLHQFSMQKWLISTGLRYNHFRISIPDETIGNSIVKPSAFVGNLAVMHFISQNSNLYFSYNSGFRAANIDDLGSLGIVDFRYELPNFNLKPESTKNYEFGYKFRNEKLAISSAIFYNKLSNLIARVKVDNQFISGIQVYKKENIENAFTRGSEMSIEKIWHKSLKSTAGIAYIFGQNITKNEPMRRIPPLNGKLDLEFHKSNFFIKPELLFAGEQTRLAQGDIDDNRIGKSGTAAWQIINFNSGYSFKSFKINILIQNLANKTYKTHGSGVYGVGRSFWLSFLINSH